MSDKIRSTEMKARVGKLIKECREEMNISQVELSYRAGFYERSNGNYNRAQQKIRKIEAGIKDIDLDELKKIANVFKKPLSYFTNEIATTGTIIDSQPIHFLYNNFTLYYKQLESILRDGSEEQQCRAINTLNEVCEDMAKDNKILEELRMIKQKIAENKEEVRKDVSELRKEIEELKELGDAITASTPPKENKRS